MDERAAIAFCDALQANSSLRELIVSNVPSLGGFHGRTLPVSLITLDWNSRVNEVVDDETLTDLATAVGRTQLKHLVCNVFGQLATYPAAAPMLAQLKWLIVSELHADDTAALIDGLSSVPALTSLGILKCSLLLSTELLLETLATTCVHLTKLKVRDGHPTRDGATAVFAGVQRLPHLTMLSMSMRLSDVLYLLPELVAAGSQLDLLDLGTIVMDEETVPEHRSDTGKRALYRALALIQNVPFVVHDLPEDIDAFVVEALGLGPRADRGHRCRLIF
ncbi:hypothetical protein SPRG_00089 [Saprolegnia parasitica CBS 223.65]|uniref:Uncharacterized protein n=1 Tax=Saprolegnia parasitica (strain CBS 223.65) TaxID=695850 RepID=A0A067CX38_SAPPC|nr:hypothetical protein SPRG_00089 [Saprolegnia parasitica CBS 223.65]KDO35244.1 hypothetical protein SPRG_00089 [Saprolegnia parasitica CBS 223.65]|eukprot:XP_012193595.1 hypothetical protein SPRG_00089 [Saprolegnia parasitica CBS 223.65]